LWYLFAYTFYTPNWFSSSNYLHSNLVPLLWWFQLV
jgi:hypothetical protein